MKINYSFIRQNKNQFKQIMKIFLFISVFFLLILITQAIVTPQWNYPRTAESDAKTLSDFYKQKPDSIDVLFFGPSTSACGISPIELYDRTNITSYNLATSGQTIFTSYFLLKEALKYQTPKVVVVELGTAIFEGTSSTNASWRKVLDSMPLSSGKIEFARGYMKYCDNPDSFMSVILPVYKYHNRWKELERNDFEYREDLFCSYGFRLSSQMNPAPNTVEEMNNFAFEMESDRVEKSYVNSLGDISYEQREDLLYDIKISEYGKDFLLKLKRLCDENNIELLTFRIPPNNIPSLKKSAWTVQRYNAIKEVTVPNNITYIDLLYDVDLQYDWQKDTQDGGLHPNIRGAEKTTAFWAEYLKTNYQFSEVQDTQWEYNKAVYKKIRAVADLQMELNFEDYVKKMSEKDNHKIYFIVCKDEMTNGLSESEITALNQLGLGADLKNSYRNSYIAVIDCGNVIYEKCSNRKIQTDYCIDDWTTVELMSSGFLCGSDCSIAVNGQEYALKNRGANIVVYDRETQQVIDTVTFDTSMSEHAVSRNATYKEEELRSYEMYWYDTILDVEK